MRLKLIFYPPAIHQKKELERTDVRNYDTFILLEKLSIEQSRDEIDLIRLFIKIH